jgi:DeoR family fructose operon transcriptional repressor
MSLIGEERKKIILDLVNTKGKINVGALSKEMKVSTETIRKYLDELESQNKLKKVYGGAVKILLEREEPSFALREISNATEKRMIALEAAKLVEDNDIIALDEGSTTFNMVEFIAYKKNLTIVTSSLPILSMLVDMEKKDLFNGKILFVGGFVNSRHLRISGAIAGEFVNSIYVRKAFISTEGLSIENGATSFDSDKALLSRKFIQNAQDKYILSDHTKLGGMTFYKICDIHELTGIICDVKPSRKWLQYMEKHNISWIVPSDWSCTGSANQKGENIQDQSNDQADC